MKQTFFDWYEQLTDYLFTEGFGRSIDKEEAMIEYDKNTSYKDYADSLLLEDTI